MGQKPLLSRIEKWNVWVTRLRWPAIIGVVILLTLSRYGWVFPLNYPVLWLLTLLFLLYNLAAFLLTRGDLGLTFLVRKPERFVPFAYLQVTTDLVLLTLFLHFAGGVENPFIFAYIFHLAMGSVLFSPRKAYMASLLAIFLLNSLLWAEYSGLVAHYNLVGLVPPDLYRNRFYLTGMGTVLSLIFVLTCYMSSVIASYLHRREEELEEAQEQLRERSDRCEVSYSELQALHREKSEFMRKVAHELRAPLSAIQSCLQVALEYFDESFSGKQRELIERAERRSGGLVEMVRDLLNLSRANETLKQAEFEEIDLHPLLESVIELAKAKAQKKNIAIKNLLGEEDLRVRGERGGLDEVFTNLVSNAVKYSLADSAVSVSARGGPDTITVSVSDQGIGISKEDLKMLFKEFFRAANAKTLQVEGTGLGLALSKKIAEIHGGDITVESTINQGSTFKVTLPREEKHPPSP